MNIAFFVSAFPTISETFILNQITGLIDRGHEVDIFAFSRGKYSQVHEDVFKYGLIQRTLYRPSIPVNKFRRLLKGIYLFVSNCHRCPVVLLRSLNVFKYGKEAANLHLLYRTIPFIGKGPYDIIHAHFGPNGLWAERMRDIGVLQGRLITTFHGYDANVVPLRYGNSCYEELFRKVNLITVSSEFIRQRVKALGANDEKLLKFPIGVNTRRFATEHCNVDPNGPMTIVTVGRLVEVKGIEYSISAIAKVLLKFPNIRYEIAGEGCLQGKLKALTTQLGISGHVLFVGAKTQDEIINLYKKARIFVLSSVRCQNGAEEGQALVLLEAQAAGLPVVATRIGGIPESVVDGVSGFLVPERDVDALAERLVYLIEHPEIWPKMGRAGRAHVQANYDIDKLNDRLVKIYQRLLSNTRNHPDEQYNGLRK